MATRSLVSLLFTANDKQVQDALTRTDKGLTGVTDTAKKSGNRIQQSFSKAGAGIKGAAGQIPGVGGALSALVSPAGLAAAGIGLVVGGLTKAIGGTLDLGRELGELREKTGISAEGLQIMRRAIEEGNGSADAFANSTVFLQRVIGEAAEGSKGAADSLAAIGLSYEDLIGLAPEEAFIRVAGATNELGSQSASTAAKAGLLGGGYRELGAFVNQTEAEIRAQTAALAENAVQMSGDQVTSVDQFDAAMRTLRDSFGGITTQVGSAFIPLLTEIIEGMTELWEEIGGPVLTVLGIFTGILGGVLRNAFNIIAGAINIVAGILTGDFSQAWRGIQQVAQGVMNQIILIYNNTIAKLPGVSEIDMLTFADNIKIAEDAAEGLAETSATSSATTVRVIGETAQAAEDAAVKVLAAERQLRIDWVKEREKLLAAALEMHKQQVQDRQDALDAEIKAIEEFREREREFQADQLTELKEQFDVTDVEYRIAQAALETLSAEKYAALIEQAEEFGIDDLALLYAHNRNAAQAALTGANELERIFTEAHEFIKESGDKGFAAYVAKIEEHLAAGVLSVQEAAALMVEALGKVGEAATGNIGGRRDDPGGLGYDRVRGGGGRKGGLDGEEIIERLANSPNGMIIDPINGTIHFAGGGKITRGGGNLRGRDLEDHRRVYDEFVALINGVTVAVDDAVETIEDVPPAVDDVVETIEEVPPALEEVPPAVDDVVETIEEVPPALEGLPPALEALPPVVEDLSEKVLTVEDRIAQMTAQVLEAQAATELETAALAGLSPEIRAAAEELGLFGLTIKEAVAPPVDLLAEGIEAFTERVLEADAARKLEAEILAALPPEIIALAQSLGILRAEVKETDNELAGTSNSTDSILRTLNVRIERLLNKENPTEADAVTLETLLAAREDVLNAQHGGIVLPRMGGTLVNVGEAGRAEAIIPLPDLAAMASNLMAGMGGGSGLGGGMGSGAGGGREVVLALDGERLGSVFLDQFHILQSENRLLVDLV